ncbi:MAG: flagellar basal-body rod protein FlgF [Xanthobacteraceae bacterium]|nr:MAG: flagellar basal-body rod protein FlgF [Xanthobacteraceae bacterium]
MENMLLVGLSRQVSLERQLGIVANNVANINTTGFKADQSLFEEYLSQSASTDDFRDRDRKVSYVVDRATWHDFAQGTYEKTGNPLDVAVEGNAFLAVQTPAGERYTRNGALQVNAQGQIVTADGNPVLGSGGPIVLQPGDQSISIARDGTVTVREGANVKVESLRGKLRLVSFDQVQRLQKEGSNLFSAPNGVTPQAAAATSGLRQGFIEKSNVSAVAEMSRMIEVMRTYTQISALLQQQNDIQKSAIEKLAEVPA